MNVVVFLLTVILSVLPVGLPQAAAEVTLITSWERPVKFKVLDAVTDAPVPQALLIVKYEKRTEGRDEPLPFYDVMPAAVTGLADYRVSSQSPGAEIKVVAPGYRLLTQKLSWQGLPPRQFDSSGLETSVPVFPLALKPLDQEGAWKREFRLVIVPELEDLLPLQPPYLSRDELRVINEFLNRERNRMLGL